VVKFDSPWTLRTQPAPRAVPVVLLYSQTLAREGPHQSAVTNITVHKYIYGNPTHPSPKPVRRNPRYIHHRSISWLNYINVPVCLAELDSPKDRLGENGMNVGSATIACSPALRRPVLGSQNPPAQTGSLLQIPRLTPAATEPGTDLRAAHSQPSPPAHTPVILGG